MPGFQRRRSGTEHNGHLLLLRTYQRDVARMVAHAVLLLIGSVMFLVDNHQFQVFQWRKYREPRADDDARLARLRQLPVLQALALTEVAV